MSTSFIPPPFPEPLISAATANPTSSATGAAFYLLVSPVQGPTHLLQTSSAGGTPLSPPHPLLPHSSIPPAFPIPLEQANHVVAIQVSPSSFPNYHSQALHIPHSRVSEVAQMAPYQDDSDEGKYEGVAGGYYRSPAMHAGDVLRVAKSPPSRPFFSGAFRSPQQTPGHPARESRLAKFFSAVFRMPRPSRRRSTLEHTVREPQLATFRCRYPECSASVRGDVAARLGGFCSDTHMWRAIREGIATQCPRCQQRVCPGGWKFCSAQCANGQTRHTC